MNQEYFLHLFVVLLFSSFFIFSKNLVVKSVVMFFIILSDALLISLFEGHDLNLIFAISISLIGLLVFGVTSIQALGSRDYSKKVSKTLRIVDFLVILGAFLAQFLVDHYTLLDLENNLFSGLDIRMSVPLIVSTFVIVIYLMFEKKEVRK